MVRVVFLNRFFYISVLSICSVALFLVISSFKMFFKGKTLSKNHTWD